jgi:hypothetical protein
VGLAAAENLVAVAHRIPVALADLNRGALAGPAASVDPNRDASVGQDASAVPLIRDASAHQDASADARQEAP